MIAARFGSAHIGGCSPQASYHEPHRRVRCSAKTSAELNGGAGRHAKSPIGSSGMNSVRPYLIATGINTTSFRRLSKHAPHRNQYVSTKAAPKRKQREARFLGCHRQVAL